MLYSIFDTRLLDMFVNTVHCLCIDITLEIPWILLMSAILFTAVLYLSVAPVQKIKRVFANNRNILN